jgi:KDO2-lipid IV(A) lauroyltransferase
LNANYIIGDNIAMASAPTQRPSFAPRNWPGWLAVGLLWLMGQMPQGMGLALSRPLGWLAYSLAGRRRQIAARNIERCFPELVPAERQCLLKDHFRCLARMLFETAWVWTAPEKRLDGWGSCEGAQYVARAREGGRGVLLLAAHSTSPELGGWYPGRAVGKPWVVYRSLRNPVIEWFSNRCRERLISGALSNKGVFRHMVEHLRSGGILWYAPDQDFGPERSAFAPFFGIPAATLKAIVHVVEQSGCKVVFLFTAFDEEKRKYVAQYHPPLQDFPSGDLVSDLSRYNAAVEEHVRRWPAQYWWIHRRFKTRPEGEPPFYD